MELSIEVSLIKQYGREEYKPECNTARIFVELLRQKVLTAQDVALIKELGYRVRLKGGEL